MENLPNVWQNLWAPWRVEYFQQKDRDPDFLLTAAQSSDDEEHLVLLRLKS